MPLKYMNHVSIKHEDGLRVSARIRQHEVIFDVPPEKGGADAGPTPVEFLAAALGACMAMHVVMYCKSAGLPYEGFGLDLDFQLAKDPLRIGSLAVDLALPPGFPGQRIESVKRAAQQCTVKNTLKDSTAVDLKIRTHALEYQEPQVS
jgi:putative redox protein